MTCLRSPSKVLLDVRDLLGEIGRRVAEGSPDRCVARGGGPGGSRPRVARPDEDVAPLIDRQALALDEFVLHILQRCVVELELPLEGAVGHAAPLAQEGDHVIHHRHKVHPISSLSLGLRVPCDSMIAHATGKMLQNAQGRAT